ncbi:MAG: hypothetical protein E6G57_15960 [Actinobacteria bacterium]|nr:MAG: hypothetical protein E6G57_15960 [Actinomycetota bacterium]
MRWMRICVVGALTVGIALTVIAGASYAAGHVVGQTGYGAPQVLGDQFIRPKNAGSSSAGLWFGLLVALVILAAAGFVGWRRTQATTEA